MKQELELNLVKKYPNLFKDYRGDMRQTCMAWGMCCGDGWYKIINSIGYQLKCLGIEDKVIAAQVKEKFGGLRFYYDTENMPMSIWDWWPQNKYIRWIWYRSFSRWARKYLTKARILIFSKTIIEQLDDIIREAEDKSYSTCEQCGADGETRSDGWIRTLCDRCYEDD